MVKSDYIFELDFLIYDRIKLLEEMEDVDFRAYNPAPEYNNFLRGHVKEVKAEVDQLLDQVRGLIGSEDTRPRFYKLLENTELPPHKDLGTLCAVNIVLNDNYAPINFEGFGDVHYTCALLDLQATHSIVPFPEERLLMKFSIFDVTYQDALKRVMCR